MASTVSSNKRIHTFFIVFIGLYNNDNTKNKQTNKQTNSSNSSNRNNNSSNNRYVYYYCYDNDDY